MSSSRDVSISCCSPKLFDSDDESIETVLNAYTTGAITFDDFLEYTGADPEQFESSKENTTPEDAENNLEDEIK